MNLPKEDRYDPERERRRARWLGNIMGGVFTIALMGIYGWMLLRISDDRDRIAELERGCPNPVVEMAEYRGVVHALDRCYLRLDEERDLNFDMKDEVDHWNYIARITNTVDEEINCQLLIERATRDFREQADDDLYICEAVREDECWCPFGMEGMNVRLQ